MKIMQIVADEKPGSCAKCIFITISSCRLNAVFRCIPLNNKKIDNFGSDSVLPDCPIRAFRDKRIEDR